MTWHRARVDDVDSIELPDRRTHRPAQPPNANGNYRVIERLAIDVLQREAFETEAEFREAVKQACADHRIDYGRHPDVQPDVVARACESARWVLKRSLEVVEMRAGRGQCRRLHGSCYRGTPAPRRVTWAG